MKRDYSKITIKDYLDELWRGWFHYPAFPTAIEEVFSDLGVDRDIIVDITYSKLHTEAGEMSVTHPRLWTLYLIEIQGLPQEVLDRVPKRSVPGQARKAEYFYRENRASLKCPVLRVVGDTLEIGATDLH
jgi:hypothetical protein